MRPELRRRRRGAPGRGVLIARLLRLERHARAQPMDPDFPDRVLAALGLSLQPPPARVHGRRGVLALALASVLGLLLLPQGGTPHAGLAAAPTWAPDTVGPATPPTPPRPPAPRLPAGPR